MGFQDVLNSAIDTFKGKYVSFVSKVTILENVIKVSLFPDPDKDLQNNSLAIAPCAKCKLGYLQIKMGAKGPILGCNKCSKEVILVTECDKIEKINQRCYNCEKYIVNVIKGSESKGMKCVLCELKESKKVAEQEKQEKKAKQAAEEGPKEEKKAKKEEKKGKEEKKKKKKKKKNLDIPAVINPSAKKDEEEKKADIEEDE